MSETLPMTDIKSRLLAYPVGKDWRTGEDFLRPESTQELVNTVRQAAAYIERLETVLTFDVNADRNDIAAVAAMPADTEMARKRKAERRAAEALQHDAEVYRTMPSDLRSRAREWRMEAFMCAVWSNAWQCGYLQAMRDQKDVTEAREPSP